MNDESTVAKTTRATVEAATIADLSHIPSLDDRLAAGKGVREKLQREGHAVWKAHDERPDPIALLQQSDAERIPELVPMRYGRMLQSPFAFFRGSAAIMASDLGRMPNTGITVQACGDCHLANFGGFATPERNVIFDINDFDETLPAPWEWDVKRLVASVVLAGRAIGISDRQARDHAVAAARTYRKRINDFARMDPLESWYQKVTTEQFLGFVPESHQKNVVARVEAAMSGSGSELDFPKLAEPVGGKIRIREQPPLIYHPEHAKTPEFQEILRAVFTSYRETLSDDRRALLDRYRVLDAAIKVVGIGSVGRRCWIALLMSPQNDPLFLQFKEAAQSVLEPYAGKSVYPHAGQRVVMGQRLMQPVSDIFLGWVTAPNGRQFYVRQLRDAKIKPMIESFNAELMEAYARACGWALARAHAKVCDVSMVAGYLGASSDAFDKAMGKFAVSYADQAERDHAALKAAVRKGKITAFKEEG
ncbi:MAG: DUF2252 domain-containing protein [Hyphomicrobiales bacterium]